jgi:hypothetical protein
MLVVRSEHLEDSRITHDSRETIRRFNSMTPTPKRRWLEFLAAMTLLSIAGLGLFCWSLAWLFYVFMDTNVLASSTPPRNFTLDRFGPPLWAVCGALLPTLLGICGIVQAVEKLRNPPPPTH